MIGTTVQSVQHVAEHVNNEGVKVIMDVVIGISSLIIAIVVISLAMGWTRKVVPSAGSTSSTSGSSSSYNSTGGSTGGDTVEHRVGAYSWTETDGKVD